MEKIKPIFKDLSKQELLKKCLHGNTQNPNESFNHCIWERIPKTIFVGLNTLKLGVLDAVICFNDGCVSRSNVLESLGIEVGQNTKKALYAIDRRRTTDGEKFALQLTKEARSRKRNAKRRREDQETQEQNEYGAGMF